MQVYIYKHVHQLGNGYEAQHAEQQPEAKFEVMHVVVVH